MKRTPSDSPEAVRVYDADAPLSDETDVLPPPDVVELPQSQDVVEDIVESESDTELRVLVDLPADDDGDSPEPEIIELPSSPDVVVLPSSPEIIEIPSSPQLPSSPDVELLASPFSPPPTPVPQPVPDPEPEPKPLAIADAASSLVCLAPCSDSDLWACVRALRGLEAEQVVGQEIKGSGEHAHTHSNAHTDAHTDANTNTDANANANTSPNTHTEAHTNAHPSSPTHIIPPKLDKYQVDKYTALVDAEDEHNIALRIGVMRLQNLVNGVDARLKRAGRFEERAAKRRRGMAITNKARKVGK